MADLKALSGPAVDMAYMGEKASLYAGDGAAFAKVGANGGSPAWHEFGMETHKIVQRHIGTIHATTPPAKSRRLTRSSAAAAPPAHRP